MQSLLRLRAATMALFLVVLCALSEGRQEGAAERLSVQITRLMMRIGARAQRGVGEGGEREEVRELGESSRRMPTGKEVKLIDSALNEESKVGLGNSNKKTQAQAAKNVLRMLAMYKKGPLSSFAVRELRGLCVTYTKLMTRKTHKPIHNQVLITTDETCRELIQHTATHHAKILKAKKAEKKLNEKSKKALHKHIRKKTTKPDPVADAKAKKIKLEKKVTKDSKALLRKLKTQAKIDAQVSAAKKGDPSKLKRLQAAANTAKSATLTATAQEKKSEAAVASLTAKMANKQAAAATKAVESEASSAKADALTKIASEEAREAKKARASARKAAAAAPKKVAGKGKKADKKSVVKMEGNVKKVAGRNKGGSVRERPTKNKGKSTGNSAGKAKGVHKGQKTGKAKGVHASLQDDVQDW